MKAPINRNDDEKWMRRAIELAREGEAVEGANPIGCVIVGRRWNAGWGLQRGRYAL
jgi:tRNA(Arg) A34 adenosine deaminase TadA